MKPLIISEEFPPNIEEIRKAFKLGGNEVFCYGRTIHNPSKKPMTEDIVEHELVHMAQQEGKIEAWWDLYISDPVFRSYQEIPAFWKQYKVAKRLIKDRNRLFTYARQLAINLSGDTYGKIMTYEEAYEVITSKKPFTMVK